MEEKCEQDATECLPKVSNKGPRLHTAPVTHLSKGLLHSDLLGTWPDNSGGNGS